MDQNVPDQTEEISAEQVAAFLNAHPDFFLHHPELLELLTPPTRHHGDNVVDLQQSMVVQLRERLNSLNDYQGTIIAATRNNLSIQHLIHEAALAVLDATSFEHMGHIVTHDWPDILQVDVVSICFENDRHCPPPEIGSERLLAEGRTAHYLDQDNAVILRGNIEGNVELFGPAAPLVQAEALIRIHDTEFTPTGILAFGTRDPDTFTPGQGTELLRFLEGVLRRCMQQWIMRDRQTPLRD
ncbi:MAG: hypothetical protein CMF31_04625 [Kordiimonas sp.]|nr:hypothetical protein [Kordiimonas sp.]